MSKADLSGANLYDANLLMANLSGTNLYRAKNTSSQQLGGASSLADTTMPDGSKHS